MKRLFLYTVLGCLLCVSVWVTFLLFYGPIKNVHASQFDSSGAKIQNVEEMDQMRRQTAALESIAASLKRLEQKNK